ncbi:selenoprotein T [Angomonas deanei]|uniref:Rdx family, putative n=1 Tax=Angomonas deanei TaxID=59799 RepID=S9VIG7_9TRYP|nr:selenoprotein T [Angomonas deanei]EPY40609.1 selenoprotein T [Angomonas deanei]CAD2214567.1 Rdx family, putative [Angomonas deanei]|eukprot:EPY33010.1 selenoprotein T [Angomonas deanei]
MKRQIQTYLPDPLRRSIVLEGDTYPVPPVKAMLSMVLSFSFMASLLTVAVTTLQTVPLPPAVLNFIAEHRSYIVGAGFVCNLVGQSLGQSGAYEVYLNDELLFSKLETGTVPQAPDVLERILDKVLLERYNITFEEVQDVMKKEEE